MQNKQPRIIIIALINTAKDVKKQRASLDEAELLVDTYGGEVVRVMTQNASHGSGRTYIGSGKVDQLSRIVEKESVDVVVINDHLKTGQLHTLKKAIDVEGKIQVWDRTQLILQIFKKHASTAEAKLQIKLAELNHKGPELSGLGITMSQQAGGIGTRGIGETHTETMHRHWKDEIVTVKKRLKKVTLNRHQQMKFRKKTGVPTVSIIGYTNAGKTTLFNVISKKQDKVEDALFATLDSSVSSLYLQNVGKKIFISDTIGFIQDLPTELVEAFRSTLLETTNADILLHVVDSTDENMDLKIETVNEVLASLELNNKKQIYVFNKMDKLLNKKRKEVEDRFSKYSHVFVSAKAGKGVVNLVRLIESELVKMGLQRAEHLRYLDNVMEENSTIMR